MIDALPRGEDALAGEESQDGIAEPGVFEDGLAAELGVHGNLLILADVGEALVG